MSENQTDNDLQIDLDTLHQKTVQDLKVIAKAIGLKGITTIRKQGVIDRIREAVEINLRRKSSSSGHQIRGKDHIQTYDEKPEKKKGERKHLKITIKRKIKSM
jgi:transcription termination factor Rho